MTFARRDPAHSRRAITSEVMPTPPHAVGATTWTPPTRRDAARWGGARPRPRPPRPREDGPTLRP
ncbi:hypothetical protein chiPu_0026938, partial [Chiloscyllium punctatum]|nr:hypothetical protein [Chiloscyllium punctatum]